MKSQIKKYEGEWTCSALGSHSLHGPILCNEPWLGSHEAHRFVKVRVGAYDDRVCYAIKIPRPWFWWMNESEWLFSTCGLNSMVLPPRMCNSLLVTRKRSNQSCRPFPLLWGVVINGPKGAANLCFWRTKFSMSSYQSFRSCLGHFMHVLMNIEHYEWTWISLQHTMR